VHLYLDNGAIIKGSTNMDDYSVDGKSYGLIYAENACNITLSGTGTLDGNGTFFHNKNALHVNHDYDAQYSRQKENLFNPEYGLEDAPIAYSKRPDHPLAMIYCENVTLKDFTILDAPFWAIRMGDCDDVLVEGIRIFNNLVVPNSDGIHLTHSRNVRISNCDLRCGDDAIIVTGFPYLIDSSGENAVIGREGKQYGNFTDYSENIIVTNCMLQSRSAGIRVGYGHFPIRNCIFSNLIIYDSNRGIGIFAREAKADIENIYFDNIIIRCRLHKGNWWGMGEPVHVSSIPRLPNDTAGMIRNVRFSNITAESEAGVVVWADKEDDIQNLLFENFKILIKESPIAELFGVNFDLRPTNSTKTSIFEHDIPGIFARHVNGFLLKDVSVAWSGKLLTFYSYALECENVKGLVLERFSGKATQPSLPAYNLKNTKLND
jgi:polygalacturonase